MKTFLKHRTKQEFINFVRESFAKLPSMAPRGIRSSAPCPLPLPTPRLHRARTTGNSPHPFVSYKND
ncbi:hypothetical protein [Desulforamulus profundi]|uniref:hypothetical protein n=1 Tax=Desulforamulus profundi TaxID=1383067 RepID=UPI001177D369|nr:hypothetical protein [Desulforamulus profundi]